VKSKNTRARYLRAEPTITASSLRLAVAALCGAAALAHAHTLPSAGQFVAGSGSIVSNGRQMTIDQSTARGIIEWDSFSIGKGDRVKFDNGSGATLNRVTGSDLSSILGRLSATGSVYLVNPQGIVIGKSGVVSTGGRFVASTLDTDNTSFMNGGQIAMIGVSNASVVNLGRIGSTHGDVFLIADHSVENRGTIDAPNGTAELVAGEAVLLQDSSTGKQVFVALGDKGSVLNSGTVRAAQISLQAADGNVFALAGKHAALRATGTLTRSGHVWLVADTGKVQLDGLVEAKNDDRSGGAVDTTATTLELCRCVPAVLAGVWNITLPSVVIDARTAAALSRSLSAGTAVNVLATGRYGATGDLDVASSIGWKGAAPLTLTAYRSVGTEQGTTIKNAGAGNLTLRADANGIDNSGSFDNRGTIDWSDSNGIVAAYYDMTGSYTPGMQLGQSTWTAPIYSGLKTQITAYQLLNSVNDLNAIGATGNYALGGDIALPSSAFVQFGTPFTGQLDGMGHSILGARGVTNYLFATIGQGGVVRNLSIPNAAESTQSAGVPSGILAGDNQGTIANVFVSGSAQGDYFDYPSDAPAVGGLVGTNEGTIVRSGANVQVSNAGWVGGLVGQNSGLILQSYATGGVSGVTNPFSGETYYQARAGGLAGGNSGTIAQSYATGSVSQTSLEGGGLVAENSGTITQSFASGSVKGVTQGSTPPLLGGIAALNTGTIGSDVYWNKDTTGQTAGGPGVSDANGLSTAQMSDPANFSGWNFGPGGAWAMPAGATQPVLEWQLGDD
jgi:filamentous hemagglutinin family protein